jgi:hypothetical protein
MLIVCPLSDECCVVSSKGLSNTAGQKHTFPKVPVTKGPASRTFTDSADLLP